MMANPKGEIAEEAQHEHSHHCQSWQAEDEAKVAQAVQELLTNQNIDFEMIFSKYAGHAVELAEQASRKHRIVAALGAMGLPGKCWQPFGRHPQPLE